MAADVSTPHSHDLRRVGLLCSSLASAFFMATLPSGCTGLPMKEASEPSTLRGGLSEDISYTLLFLEATETQIHRLDQIRSKHLALITVARVVSEDFREVYARIEKDRSDILDRIHGYQAKLVSTSGEEQSSIAADARAWNQPMLLALDDMVFQAGLADQYGHVPLEWNPPAGFEYLKEYLVKVNPPKQAPVAMTLPETRSLSDPALWEIPKKPTMQVVVP